MRDHTNKTSQDATNRNSVSSTQPAHSLEDEIIQAPEYENTRLDTDALRSTDSINTSTLARLQQRIGNQALVQLLQRREARQTSGQAHIQRQNEGADAGSSTVDSSTSSHPPAYRVNMVGHASPRWEHTHGDDSDELNLNLSQERVNAVETLFAELMMQYHPQAASNFTSQAQNDEVYMSGGNGVTSSAVGDRQTTQEADGNNQANDPQMRRVDIDVDITQQSQASTASSQTVTYPEVQQDAVTRDWSVKILFVTTGGEGIYAGVGMGIIKNRRTGQTARGTFIAGGGGAGVELPIPAAAPNPEWTDFQTRSPTSFNAFDGATVRFTHLDVGIGIAGYSFGYLTFTDLMDGPANVSGFVMNQWGVGGSVTAGQWHFDNPPPAPPTVPESSGGMSVAEETTTTSASQYNHRVLFETGSAEITDAERERLEAFVMSLS